VSQLGSTHVLRDCKSCAWNGAESDLVEATIKPPPGLVGEDALRIAQAVSEGLLHKLHAQAAAPIMRAIVSAGIVGPLDSSKVLTRVLRAAVIGAHKATLEEVEKIQTEKDQNERVRPS